MRRTLLFQSARIVRRRTRYPLFDGFQLRLDRLDILVLAEHCIAEFHEGALEIGNFRLNPLERVILSRAQRFAP